MKKILEEEKLLSSVESFYEESPIYFYEIKDISKEGKQEKYKQYLYKTPFINGLFVEDKTEFIGDIEKILEGLKK